MSSATSLPTPIAPRERIAVLDIMRGIAILGIFYMNIPYMGASGWLATNDVRSIGWSAADAATWSVIDLFAEGTMRGMLEMLFGAGLMILTRREDADTTRTIGQFYLRRTLWLFGFGMLDVFVLGWPGDILHIYAIAALMLYPFRRLPPRVLILLGLSFALFNALASLPSYVEDARLAAKVEAIAAHGGPVTAPESKVIADWSRKADAIKLDPTEQRRVAAERAAHRPGTTVASYLATYWQIWFTLTSKGNLLAVPEALCAMLIGVAMFKLGFIQGRMPRRAYLIMMLVGYTIGLTLRGLALRETLSFLPGPRIDSLTYEAGRLAMSIGHVALINFAVQTVVGAQLLAPFKAAGRTAFSLYLLQQVMGLWWLFAPWGLGLWGRYSWAGLAAIATVVVAVQLIVANLWMRGFVAGPVEWLWRSLSYGRVQPFRRVATGQVAIAA